VIDRPLFASLSRISDLAEQGFSVEPLPSKQWATGDYVVGEVTSRFNASSPVELVGGRMTEVNAGDHIVGALGIRAATLEAAGHWNAIDTDGQMHALTAAGLFGRATSVSPFIPKLLQLYYRGHVVRDGRIMRMSDFVPTLDGSAYDRPTVLLIGTSMSSGKTTSGNIIIRELIRMGLNVVGVKFTGAGRLRDTLAMQDAGAAQIFDFVDAGLPSTVCPPEQYKSALDTLLAMVQTSPADVVVAEAGASPLEPYNGDTLLARIRSHVRCTVLCASDPYAVLGVTKGFGFDPDFVSGVATSTSAGVDVIHNLTGCTALNLLDPACTAELRKLLEQELEL